MIEEEDVLLLNIFYYIHVCWELISHTWKGEGVSKGSFIIGTQYSTSIEMNGALYLAFFPICKLVSFH